ncbi:hypothetical protein BDFB_001635, partial [Asbolus verrucosus]
RSRAARPVARRAAFSTYTDYRAALTTVLKKQLGVTLAAWSPSPVGRRRWWPSSPRAGIAPGALRASRAVTRGPLLASSSAALLPGGETCRCRGTGGVTQHLEAPARREEAAMQRRKRDSLPSLGNELGSGAPGRRRRRGRGR